MKYLILTLSILTFVACEKNKESIDISIIKNYIIMDPFEESVIIGDLIQDTVFYHFKDEGKMTKIRLNYSLIDNKIALESKDTVECIYYIDSNHLFMTTDWESIDYLVPMFGKDNNEWVVLKLNSDTLIIDHYQNGEKRIKVGHYGFSVLETR